MHTIELPYFATSWRYLQELSDCPGLIWYHNGHDSLNQEWISACPSVCFQYLGEHKTRVLFDTGETDILDGDYFEHLKNRSSGLEMGTSGHFSGGLAGHLSYDLGLELLGIPSAHPPLSAEPLATVGLYLWSLQIDHQKQRACLCIQDDCSSETKSMLTAMTQRLHAEECAVDSTPVQLPDWESLMSKKAYHRAFDRLKEYIVAGDCYQANLTRQWVNHSASLTMANDLSLYRQLSAAMPAPFSVFHRTDTHSLLSVSPERFIQIRGDQVMTQPIKGTRPRGLDALSDQREITALQNSEKDRAENLMIVDLLRNDIARHALPGTVTVDKLFEIQSFENVHHLVSTISAIRKPQSHALDILRDAFPGGSITGAPKKRAMEIIDELETTRRGQYCGCSFYVNANGDLDSNILIRTMTLTEGKLTCSGGGGIVYDSEATSEYEESAIKVRRLLDSLSLRR